MLLNLRIKNYVLIDELALEFGPGLNIFTGETGAGKSIIIESIGLLLGERAAAGVVRGGAEKCFLSAEFDITGKAALNTYLVEAGLAEAKNEPLLLRREIDTGGKTRSFANDRPVSLATLAAIGDFLIDVHGQHEHQTLLANKAQRELLDRFARNEELLELASKEYSAWRALAAQKETRQISEQERERLVDLYGFQLKEIDAAKLSPGEEEEIEQKLPMLKNADKLMGLSSEACELLYGQEGSAIEKAGKTSKLLESIGSLSGALTEPGETLKNASALLDDVLRDLEKFRDSLNADPSALNDLLTRQDLIHRLKKKYGKDIPEILAYRDRIKNDLDALTNADKNLKELDEKIRKAEAVLLDVCGKLTAQRKKAAKKLSEGAQKELSELGMKKAVFSVKIEQTELPSATGRDAIEFLFSANAGQAPAALKAIASGGEMSRVMLALKTVLAKSDEVPVLIFDEIDTGIGGPMGQTVGSKLKTLAGHHQILCITHLPQIAAFAENHYTVEKSSSGARTSVTVKMLAKNERLEEVARMLSGKEITPVARKHASELIEQSFDRA